MRQLSRFMLLLVMLFCASLHAQNQLRSVRVAITGGIADNGFWDEICERFEKKTGIKIETVSTGQKDGAPAAFKKGGIDLLMMYSGDAIMTLAAEGYAMDVQPWLSSDLALVGPADDPARVQGSKDLAEAMNKIIETKSALIIHGSLGTDVVIRNVVQKLGLELEPAHVTILLDDHQRQVLQVAATKMAYTLIARVPFQSGKLDHGGLAVMLTGDPTMRRPFIFVLANPQKISDIHLSEARQLATFLRTPEVQNWIAGFNKGKFDDKPEFYPVLEDVPTTRPADTIAELRGEIARPLNITVQLLRTLPRSELKVKNEAGQELTYSGVLIRDVLKAGGAPIGDHQFRGPHARLAVFVGAADGYVASFSLADFDEDFGERSILLADTKDGKPLPASEGPLRVVAPQDQRQARWVRQVAWIEIR